MSGRGANDGEVVRSEREWQALEHKIREQTPARLMEGRAGVSYRTATLLQLRADHAAARDAVQAELDLNTHLGPEFVERWGIFEVSTRARTKAEYLLRPELGRLFNEAAHSAALERCPRECEMQIVIGDGLSVRAVAVQLPGLLPLLMTGAGERGWRRCQVFAIRHCRVGVMNEIGELLAPAVVVLLVGERPGLATAESLSAYLAYRPRAGHDDSHRNLVSNIHAKGVSVAESAERILRLVESMLREKRSGVDLKEQLPASGRSVRSLTPQEGMSINMNLTPNLTPYVTRNVTAEVTSNVTQHVTDVTPMVTPAWLAARLNDPGTVVLDATLPPVGVTPTVDTHGRYLARHIPGAIFFDIDELSDHSTALPHMLPAPEDFARAMSVLGIADGQSIVVYEQKGVFSAPRAWWMLRTLGAREVHILDGGLRAWLESGYATEAGQTRRAPASFHAEFHRDAVKDFAQIQRMIAERGQILDARSASRFSGAAPEPRPGINSGHMPGAINIPFTELAEGGCMMNAARLGELFAGKGVDLNRPITTSCGSGVTAAVVALGLAIAGARQVSLYDGSWAEYAQRPEAVIEKNG
jgi:thiosulfate/3-mercaptopyruvate sulfurtransferase